MRKLALVGILVAFFTTSFGQRAQIGFFYLPQKTSISNSISDKSDPIYQNKTTFGGGAGINFTYLFDGSQGIQTGIFYASHNQKFQSKILNSGTYTEVKGKKRLDYLKVPLLYTYSMDLTRQMGFSLSIGPQLSYLLKGSGAVVIYKHFEGVDFYDLPPSGNDFYNKFVLEAAGGAGLYFNLTPELCVSTSLRIDYSLSDVENKNAKVYEDLDTPTNLYSFGDPDRKKAHNSSIGIMLGFNYNLAGKHDLMKPGGGGRRKRR